MKCSGVTRTGNVKKFPNINFLNICQTLPDKSPKTYVRPFLLKFYYFNEASVFEVV